VRCSGEVISLCADGEVAESVGRGGRCNLGRESHARGRRGRCHDRVDGVELAAHEVVGV